MNGIVSELETFAKQYKNCENLEFLLREKYNKIKPSTPILLILASGFLYNTPYLKMINGHPHLEPFKKSIISILDGTKTNNVHINTTRDIISTF